MTVNVHVFELCLKVHINVHIFLLMIRLMIEGGVAITSVSCRTWASREARDPTLLLSCADNSLRLYRYDTCT